MEKEGSGSFRKVKKMPSISDLKVGKAYKFKTKDRKRFVGYLQNKGKSLLTFRVGINDIYIECINGIDRIKEISPRDVEIREKNGRYFTY